jgi:hydrogenase maturation protease
MKPGTQGCASCTRGDAGEPWLVIGIGNLLRRDDGAGPWVVRRLEKLTLPGLQTLEHAGDGMALLDRWHGHPRVCVVDATRSGAVPGTVRHFDTVTKPLPRDLFHPSSHLFGVAEAVELARLQGVLPGRLEVFGIEGGDFGFGEGVSDEVVTGVTEVVTAIETIVLGEKQ